MAALWIRAGQALANETSSQSPSNDPSIPMSMTSDNKKPLQPAVIAAFAVAGVVILALSLYLTMRLATQTKAKKDRALLASFSQVTTSSTLNTVDLEKKSFVRRKSIPVLLGAPPPIASIPRPEATVPPRWPWPAAHVAPDRAESPPTLTRINTGVTIITIPEPTATQPATSSAVPPKSPNDFRTVQSAYHPLLADELSVQVGERLLILERFDDGWSIVSRETLIKWDLNLGAVPDFVFEKGVQGMKERGMRTSSLSKSSGVPQSVLGGGKRLVANTWGSLRAKV